MLSVFSKTGVPDQRGALPPGPKGLPLLGSALDLRRDLLGSYLQARREHGDVVRFSAGPPGMRLVLYGVFHPDGVQRILATESGRYRKDNTWYEELRLSFGDGLLTSQDDTWLRQKRFTQPLFTKRRVEGYAAVMAGEAAGLVHRWQASPDRTVELYAEMSRLALQVVARILFGADVHAAVPVVRRAFPVLGDYVLARGFAPVALPRGWPTRANRRSAEAERAVKQICAELIARRRVADSPGDDLLGLLVGASEDGQQLADAEVRDQVLVFLFAGYDTTAIALTFALHLLARHPQAQDRAVAEVDEVLSGRPPSAADAARLGYLSAVLKEAMRIYPPAAAMGRRCPGGDQIGGYTLPPGADVYISPWVTHRHPDFWPDPERFDPDRFAPEREAGRHRYAWFPFGGGPRLCIGQYFSMLESVIALATVLQAFRLDTEQTAIPVTLRITLNPAAPVPVRLTPR
jgi:cytochrome P450